MRLCIIESIKPTQRFPPAGSKHEQRNRQYYMDIYMTHVLYKFCSVPEFPLSCVSKKGGILIITNAIFEFHSQGTAFFDFIIQKIRYPF